jgi:uncharacterized membrane protein
VSIRIAACAAAVTGIILVTVAQTREAYPRLPERVPIHIGPAGNIDGYGPKGMIWMLVGVQITVAMIEVAAGFALASNAPHTHGSPLGLAVIAVCVTALLWRVQNLLVAAATSGETSVPMRKFWLFFGATMMCVVLAAMFL